MRFPHIHRVALRHVLRVILAGASFLVPVSAALCGARRTRVPSWHIQSTAETNVPNVVILCVTLNTGGHSLCRWWGSSVRRRCYSECCAVTCAPTWSTSSFSVFSSSTSSISVVPASATSNGRDVCLCWLIRRGGRGRNCCVRCLGYGSWRKWLLHGRLLIRRWIRRWPCRECLRLHLWAGLRHQCHLLLCGYHCLSGCRHFSS